MLIKNGDYPIDETKDVVRYMDFVKFADLVLSEKLFFANASLFTDQYEFNFTPDHQSEVFNKYKDMFDENKANETVQVYKNTARIHKKKFYISSWSEKNGESYALWKIYLKGQEGVSITTDFDLLKEVMAHNDRFIEIGKVKYSNKLGDQSNNPMYALRKKTYYQYENEVRLTHYNTEQQSPGDFGIKEPVNIDKLIKEIRLSPFSNRHFEDLVHTFLKRIKPTLIDRIVKSEIKDI